MCDHLIISQVAQTVELTIDFDCDAYKCMLLLIILQNWNKEFHFQQDSVRHSEDTHLSEVGENCLKQTNNPKTKTKTHNDLNSVNSP